MTSDLPKNLELDITKMAEAVKKGPEAAKKMGRPRDELSLYYFNAQQPKVFLNDDASCLHNSVLQVPSDKDRVN